MNYKFNNFTKFYSVELDAMIYNSLSTEEYAMVVEVTVTRNRRAIITMNDDCVRCINFNSNLDVIEIMVL